MPSAAEQLLETADRLVDEILLRVLAALLTAKRAVCTIDEGAAHYARYERRIGPHADIRQPTGQAKRYLEQLLVIRRPARVLDAANDVGGERRPGDELRRQVEAAVETRRPATGDRVGRRTHHEVVGPRLPVGDPGGGAQLLEARVGGAEELRMLRSQALGGERRDALDTRDPAEDLVDEIHAVHHAVVHLGADRPRERAPDRRTAAARE